MSDKIVDTAQLVNGVAILFSFYVGYKYGLSVLRKECAEKELLSNSSKGAKEDEKPKWERLRFSENSGYKMALVVRSDLKMGKGKIAAQCCHAAVAAYQKAVRTIPHMVKDWENAGSAKIALKVGSEIELRGIKKLAELSNFNTYLVHDAGRTQIKPNSVTVLAIGPADSFHLDRVTGQLKLL